MLATASALQFSNDRTVEKSWFRSYECSEYEQQNSLDLQSIAKADEAYDLVICNHVLEHVPDDIAALRELARITSSRGFIFLAVPDPVNRTHTRDWGYPDEAQHGHYRIYGRDIHEKFLRAIPTCPVISHRTRDPVTDVEDLVYLIFKAKEPAVAVASLLDNSEFLQGSSTKSHAASAHTGLFMSTTNEIEKPGAIQVARYLSRLATIAYSPSLLDEQVLTEIAPGDNMNMSTTERYFAVGRSAMSAIAKALICHGATAEPQEILDFACGFGRVARYLRAAFPSSTLTAADAWYEAVDFTATTFGARRVHSARDFSRVELPVTFDLIWCGSLITHLAEKDALAIIDLFEHHLKPGGLMVFTTHGRQMRRLRKAGRQTYKISDEQFAEMDALYEVGRYSFTSYPDQLNYGISLSPPQWAVSVIGAHPVLSLVCLTESGWDNHQDVIAASKLAAVRS